MRITLAHFKTQTLQHLRSPGYLLPTLAWLLLAYLGGLWETPAELPRWAAEASPYLPTRLWGSSPGRPCKDRPPRSGTGWASRATPWASRSSPYGATGATRAPATAEGRAVRSRWLRRPTEWRWYGRTF
jgi:hypothetical protein